MSPSRFLYVQLYANKSSIGDRALTRNTCNIVSSHFLNRIGVCFKDFFSLCYKKELTSQMDIHFFLLSTYCYFLRVQCCQTYSGNL